MKWLLNNFPSLEDCRLQHCISNDRRQHISLLPSAYLPCSVSASQPRDASNRNNLVGKGTNLAWKGGEPGPVEQEIVIVKGYRYPCPLCSEPLCSLKCFFYHFLSLCSFVNQSRISVFVLRTTHGGNCCHSFSSVETPPHCRYSEALVILLPLFCDILKRPHRTTGLNITITWKKKAKNFSGNNLWLLVCTHLDMVQKVNCKNRPWIKTRPHILAAIG